MRHRTHVPSDVIPDGKFGTLRATKLETHDVTGAPPTWSPDDKDIFAHAADLTQVFVISVDGTHPQLSIPTPGKNYANGTFQRLALD